MKLTITRNLGKGWPDYAEGQSVEVEDKGLAELLVKRGYAEREPGDEPPAAIKAVPKETVKAVPDEAEVAEDEPPKPTYTSRKKRRKTNESAD